MKNNTGVIITTMILLTLSANAMKFSNSSQQNIGLDKINGILNILNLRTEQLEQVKDCISISKSENDIAKCRILNAKTKNVMKKKIHKTQSTIPGTSSF